MVEAGWLTTKRTKAAKGGDRDLGVIGANRATCSRRSLRGQRRANLKREERQDREGGGKNEKANRAVSARKPINPKRQELTEA
jgi:hypothetical protein